MDKDAQFRKAVAGFAAEVSPRSIPIYEAKNRIQSALEQIETMVTCASQAVDMLENRMANVLAPVPPQCAENSTSSPATGVQHLKAIPVSQSPLCEELHNVAKGGEAITRSIDLLRMRINALTDRIEA